MQVEVRDEFGGPTDISYTMTESSHQFDAADLRYSIMCSKKVTDQSFFTNTISQLKFIVNNKSPWAIYGLLYEGTLIYIVLVTTVIWIVSYCKKAASI